MEIIRTLLIVGFLGFGLFIFGVAIFGMFKFKYVLNRIHSAAMTDTLGTFCIIVALMIYTGWNVLTLKLFLVLLFMWLTGPVAVHLLGQTEVITNRKGVDEETEVVES